MPWLLKDQRDLPENLLFVHVPRCGGTSLTQHFDVPRKARAGRCPWGIFGIVYFFYRYRLLESANFPVKSWESLIALLQLLASLFCFAYGRLVPDARTPVAAYTLLVGSICMFTYSTFLATAPFIGRVWWIRRPYLLLNHYVLFRFMESIPWCTGTNKKGYMMHLTAQKLLKYGYVSEEEMNEVSSMAIVRNPYSRMVSIYGYNRYGPLETFTGFVRRWHNIMVHYRERGEMEEWWTPCHCIPQFEYTHKDGKQIVQSVVKQEELRYLRSKDSIPKAIAMDNTVADLPDAVRNALLGMPHTNKRQTGKAWWEYFDQETLNITYELYKKDFLVFGYSPKLDKRPDLRSPDLEVAEEGFELMRRNSRQAWSPRLSGLKIQGKVGEFVLSVKRKMSLPKASSDQQLSNPLAYVPGS
mmetsp:Transcript_32160/g.91236  ORF Transcript_32160/g.91236 Transcript_32160/m.91236 type:complete len:413 (-) Transcript_32160:402-1640(-)|eukprot:CAMPEP_0117672782 /NCGR_PEP_ID=MMETSP0804-20121206/14101_1 /TAXON_ID=1074897 /ORGANISM="Tetraselmis astigmatica, Strain CCMP880" /LENGTH=412 /DNA_ID=CAMNT_0005481433 /DNA_START=121 /DNA_END=1359 /DNA_ORIENTATION=-